MLLPTDRPKFFALTAALAPRCTSITPCDEITSRCVPIGPLLELVSILSIVPSILISLFRSYTGEAIADSFAADCAFVMNGRRIVTRAQLNNRFRTALLVIPFSLSTPICLLLLAHPHKVPKISGSSERLNRTAHPGPSSTGYLDARTPALSYTE